MIPPSSTARFLSRASVASYVALGYAAFGAVWIYFSDQILAAVLRDRPALLIEVQTLKGWLFVALSAVLIYFVISYGTRLGRRTAATLAISQQRFDVVVDSMQDYLIAMIDPSGHIVSWNKGAERISGYSAAEIVGQHLSRFYTAQDIARGEPVRILAHALERGRAEIDGWRVRKDGTPYWAFGLTTAIRDRSGALLGFINVSRDTTERHEAEQALKESERRLRDFAEAASDWLWETDADLRFTYISDRFLAATGVAREDWLGRRRDEVPVISEDQAASAELMEHMRARRPFRNIQYSFVDGQNRRHIAQVSAKPLFDADGNFLGYRGVGTDVTSIQTTEAQLRQAQKMEAVGQLTGGIAHDFNNLLSVLVGNIELVHEGLPGDSKLRELTTEALAAGRRGAELTHRLLAFARRQPLKPAVTDLNSVVLGMSQLLQRTLGATIEVETVLTAGLWKSVVDPGLIENALFNLAINARDAMPKGGKLSIETGNVRLSEEYASENAEVVPGRYVMIAVSDTGTGMTPEVLERAFEPFFTTKESGKGSGLGLSMVYGFVKQSGGHIKIYSEPGRGTTVRMYLPYTDAAGQTTDWERAAGVEPAGSGEVVLVVEDDAAVRRLALRLLKALGYHAIEATSGRAALEIFDRAPKIDAVLTDMVLPDGMSGIELVSALRERRAGLPVIYMSGYTENALRDKTANEMFVAKPFSKGDLARALRRALKEKGQADDGRSSDRGG